MKYSRKQIDRVGLFAAAEPFDALEHAEAMTIIDDLCKLHLPVLNFPQDYIVMANEIHARKESGVSKQKAAIAMVAVYDKNELREALPKYFLNAHRCITALPNFQYQYQTNGI